MRKHVAQSFQDGQSEVRRRRLKREALADEAGQLALVIDGVEAGQYAACAVTKDVDRKAWLTNRCEIDNSSHVRQVVANCAT